MPCVYLSSWPLTFIHTKSLELTVTKSIMLTNHLLERGSALINCYWLTVNTLVYVSIGFKEQKYEHKHDLGSPACILLSSLSPTERMWSTGPLPAGQKRWGGQAEAYHRTIQ